MRSPNLRPCQPKPVGADGVAISFRGPPRSGRYEQPNYPPRRVVIYRTTAETRLDPQRGIRAGIELEQTTADSATYCRRYPCTFRSRRISWISEDTHSPA